MNKKQLNESFQSSVQKILPELKFNEIRVASLNEGPDDKVLKVLNSAQVNTEGDSGPGGFEWWEEEQEYIFDDGEGGFDYNMEVKPIGSGFKVWNKHTAPKSFSNIEAVKKYIEQLYNK